MKEETTNIKTTEEYQKLIDIIPLIKEENEKYPDLCVNGHFFTYKGIHCSISRYNDDLLNLEPFINDKEHKHHIFFHLCGYILLDNFGDCTKPDNPIYQICEDNFYQGVTYSQLMRDSNLKSDHPMIGEFKNKTFSVLGFDCNHCEDFSVAIVGSDIDINTIESLEESTYKSFNFVKEHIEKTIDSILEYQNGKNIE